MQQTPVSYAESIVAEIELRIGTQRKDMQSLLNTYRKIKEGKQEDFLPDVREQLDGLFSNSVFFLLSSSSI